MVNPLLLPEFRKLLAEQNAAELREMLYELHPASIADFSEGLSVEETWELLGFAPIEQQEEIFTFYSHTKQEQLASGVGRERMSALLERMSHDDRVDLLKRLDDEVVESLLPLVAKAEREDIRKLMSYREHTVGSVMTTDYATLPPEVSVDEAVARLRRQAPAAETIYFVYVVDKEHRLLGVVSLRDLILARPSALVRDLMQTDPISVRAEQDREDVAQEVSKYDLLAIPVVDAHNRLVGIVTHDDVADVVEEEATEDFHLTAAISPLARGYGQSGVWPLYSRRIGWLVILVFVNLVSSGVIAAYEEVLAAAITLAFFLPLLIDSGGNTGSQAATLIIRALATGEITLRQWWKVVIKELVVGLSLGLTMAVASAILGYFRGGAQIGLIVGISMFCIVIITNLVGVLLPFVLTKLRIDPAVASSPLITTVADASGLLIYFTIATWILGLPADV
jgi:magnesium transporter